jgi:hypothetical protein
MGRAMKAVTALQSVKGKEKDASKFVSSVIKKVAQYSSIQKMDEYSILAEAKPFLEKEFSCPVEIQKSGSAVYDPAKKAGNSIPLKPAIYME